jgi:putative N6-adenine-specific DNA methylase
VKDYFAITAPGIEEILSLELKQLGLRVGKRISGGVEFRGSRADMRRANLWSRTANRIVMRVDEFHASSFHELERRAKKIEWGKFLVPGSEVRFRVTCRKSRLYHSDAVAERLQKAVTRAIGASVTHDVDDDEADVGSQLFIVRLSDDVCTISIDSSGQLLHRRGYRQAIAKAPLRETIAAAMVIGSEWDMHGPLVDPMCGAGTIAIEGAMLARKIAPGIGRGFAFEQWPGHDEAAWKLMKEEAKQGELAKAPGPIIASDRDAGAVTAAKANAERAGVSGDIDLSQRAISAVEFPDTPGWIVTNPPYGLRVGESGTLRNLYSQIGKILRGPAKGYFLALLSADRELDAQLRLDLEEVFRTTNGGIPVRLVRARAAEGR